MKTTPKINRMSLFCIRNNRTNILPMTSNNDFVSHATNIIEQLILCERYSLEMFANDLSMSKSSLSHKMKKITGLTPCGFIENVKLNYARSLINESDISIKEIAYSSGFNDPKYFSKRFKKIYGVTPLIYKNSIKRGVSYLWEYFNLN